MLGGQEKLVCWCVVVIVRVCVLKCFVCAYVCVWERGYFICEKAVSHAFFFLICPYTTTPFNITNCSELILATTYFILSKTVHVHILVALQFSSAKLVGCTCVTNCSELILATTYYILSKTNCACTYISCLTSLVVRSWWAALVCAVRPVGGICGLVCYYHFF
jgi:hypothetical protein